MLVEVGVEVPGDPVGGEVGDGAEVLPVRGVLAVTLQPHALVLKTQQALHSDVPDRDALTSSGFPALILFSNADLIV